MRELTDDFKLSARSCPETHDAIGRIRTAIAKARGKRPSIERVINWTISYVGGLEPAEMDRLLRIGQQVLDGIEPLPAAGEAKLRPGYGPKRPKRLKRSNGEADHSKPSAGKC